MLFSESSSFFEARNRTYYDKSAIFNFTPGIVWAPLGNTNDSRDWSRFSTKPLGITDRTCGPRLTSYEITKTHSANAIPSNLPNHRKLLKCTKYSEFRIPAFRKQGQICLHSLEQYTNPCILIYRCRVFMNKNYLLKESRRVISTAYSTESRTL